MQNMLLNMQEWVMFLLIALVLLGMIGLTCWAAFQMIGAVLRWVFNKREEYLKQRCRSKVRTGGRHE